VIPRLRVFAFIRFSQVSKEIEKATQDAEYGHFERTCKDVEDPTLLILRVHLLAEYYLERLIHLTLERGDRVISDAGLSFYQKLVLVDSFDRLSDSIIQSLKGLNKIRNRIAHDAEKRIAPSDVEVIARPLGRVCTKYRTEHANSPEDFLRAILSYVCGYIAGQVGTYEYHALEQGKKKSADGQA
jgi:hypothetical protein